MTYSKVKALATALLGGDTMFPDNEEQAIATLAYAMYDACMISRSNDLVSPSNKIPMGRELLRVLNEEECILVPLLPSKDSDELDIDEGLCFAVARFMASIISFEKMDYHRNIAKKLAEQHNATLEMTRSIME